MRLPIKKITASLTFFSALAFGGIDLQSINPDLTLSISGKGWVEAGQYVFYYNQGQPLDHTFISRTFMDLVLDATYKKRLRVSLGTEGRMWFNVPKVTGTGQATYVHRQNGSLIVSDANASYSLGNLESPFFSVTAGLFPFKYNTQVRNLGEYLFRSGTYPAFLINNFDLAFARLTGVKLSSDLFGFWHQDLIYSIETTIPPFFDGTISYFSEFNIVKFADFGMGASWANLVSVDERVTTPEKVGNNRYVVDGDTGYYSFRGIKLMGKVCLDPKRFIPFDIFGKEDLKIYAEAAILGVQNYPRNDTLNPLNPSISVGKNIWGYDTLMNKVPIMFGFNFPTFKMLDVLAVELEYYRCPYANSYKNRLGPGKDLSYPVPDPIKRTNLDYHDDDWKWSIYAKRTFFDEHVGIVLQFARDHIRNETLVDESFDYEEALSEKNHWWWMMKLLAQF